MNHTARTICSGVVAMTALCATSGCAIHNQIQHFAVEDPDTGTTLYYRMRLEGGGGAGTDYHLQAGYFSAAAVDVLRGQMPKVPELDLPIEQIELYDRLLEEFYGMLLEQAKAVANRTDAESMKVVASSMSAFTKRRVDDLNVELNSLTARLKIQEDHSREFRGMLDNAETNVNTTQKAVNDAETALAGASEADKPARQADLNTANGRLQAAQESRNKVMEKWQRSRLAEDTLRDDLGRITSRRDQFESAAAAAKTRMETLSAAAKDAVATPRRSLSPDQFENQVVRVARTVWFGTLSGSDVASVGMTGSTDPYQFRKLVFWTTAKNIDLNQFSSEIDGVIENVLSIGNSFKQVRKQRKAEKAQQREHSMELIRGFISDPEKRTAIESAFNLVQPSTGGEK